MTTTAGFTQEGGTKIRIPAPRQNSVWLYPTSSVRLWVRGSDENTIRPVQANEAVNALISELQTRAELEVGLNGGELVLCNATGTEPKPDKAPRARGRHNAKDEAATETSDTTTDTTDTTDTSEPAA